MHGQTTTPPSPAEAVEKPRPPRRAKGAMIQQHREALGITRSELADRVGCTYKHMHNVERGYKDASVELLHRIALELDVAPSAVMYRKPVRFVVVQE